uniref:Uncharacterized protein n=1 Tax=Salix viminalis TaxID=40686 RepID=A0A6N2KJT1_SALVM
MNLINFKKRRQEFEVLEIDLNPEILPEKMIPQALLFTKSSASTSWRFRNVKHLVMQNYMTFRYEQQVQSKIANIRV